MSGLGMFSGSARRYNLLGYPHPDSHEEEPDLYDEPSTAGNTYTDNDSITGASRTGSLVSTSDADMYSERSKLYDDIANKGLQPSEVALWIRMFVKHEDIPFARTYVFGRAVKDQLPDSATPKVGLVFLPGADLPEVNRLEQHGMFEGDLDQKDALWRVNTAGQLLTVSFVKDLNIVTYDNTREIAEHAQKRLQEQGTQLPSRRREREIYKFRRDAVTLNSDNITLYNELKPLRNGLDIAATLIEVNVSSLMALMVDYRYIVSNSGPRMTFQQTKDLLDRMIEAARRFCLNSPILFRMSTRNRIIEATDIRYGVNNEQGFHPFTSSRGIQDIIKMSASYFDSLDPSAPGMDELTQREIRPRFLQMLALLLSLLTEDDLRSMSVLVTKTYGVNPARQEMELLFCKVIPLTSINSTIFLQALISAVDGHEVKIQDDQEHSLYWKKFVREMAQRGYLLPGTLEDLGHPQDSWILGWPETGIKSSTNLARLQFHGQSVGTFNEIPPGRFRYEPELTELTILATDNLTYSIHPQDYEHIATLTKGHYTVTRCDDSEVLDLEMTEVVLNRDVNEAIRSINDAIRRFNARASLPRGGGRMMLRKKNARPLVFPDLPPSTRLTRNEARLNGAILAVAYKLDGKNVPRVEALRSMQMAYSRVKSLFSHLCEQAGRSIEHYESYISNVQQHLNRDRQVQRAEKDRTPLSDSPIAQAFHPEDSYSKPSAVWFGYHIDIRYHHFAHRPLLHMRAKSDVVRSVTWRKPGHQAEIRLAQYPAAFFVGPLKPVLESQQGEEVRVGDFVLLVGRYMVVAGHDAQDAGRPAIMLNWLEIQSTLSEEVGRRGRNMRAREELPETVFL